MKKNVRFMLKVAIISVLFIFVVAARSFAAQTGNVNFNVDFSNIPEAGSSSSDTPTDQGGSADEANQGGSTAPTDTGNTKSTNSSNSSEDSSKKSTSTSSTSNKKMPATGSNIEIIFCVAAIVIVSGAIFFYKKQNIKLK